VEVYVNKRPVSRPPLSVVLRFRLRFTSAFVRLRRDKAAFASIPPGVVSRLCLDSGHRPDATGRTAAFTVRAL